MLFTVNEIMMATFQLLENETGIRSAQATAALQTGLLPTQGAPSVTFDHCFKNRINEALDAGLAPVRLGSTRGPNPESHPRVTCIAGDS